MIRYSVIVPYRGCPELLQRALASIPSREDVEVLPIEDADGRGAGWARNIGLGKAQGEWLVFLDSDDFFTAEAFDLLDAHAKDVADLVCFNVQAVMSDNGMSSARQADKQRLLGAYASRPAELAFYCRYCYPEPWGKMVRRDFVRREGILFDETVCANDYMFSVLCGLKAREVTYDQRVMYVVTEREGSVSRQYFDSPRKLQDRLSVYWRVQQLFDGAGVPLQPFYGLWMLCGKEGGERAGQARAFCRAQGISRWQLWKGCAIRVIRKRLRIGVPNNA